MTTIVHLYSMTGFGRSSAVGELGEVSVEIQSVNRKQAEVQIQLPKELSALESCFRKKIQASISRGKITVNMMFKPLQSVTTCVLDQIKAAELENAFKELSKQLGRVVYPQASDFLRVAQVNEVSSPAFNLDLFMLHAEPVFLQALESFLKMRKDEGAVLKQDLEQRLEVLSHIRQEIIERAEQQPATQRQQLFKRLEQAGLNIQLNDERVLKELALFADRCDITEELTRLQSHLEQFYHYLNHVPACGRSLDFLCQELLREWNTMGSKSASAEMTHLIVTAKTEVEKIREQVQNIE